MDIGLQMVFASYGWSGLSDEQVWDEEIKLARLAADSGLDALWSVEHHFNDYSLGPDNLQLMTYLAGFVRTSTLARQRLFCRERSASGRRAGDHGRPPQQGAGDLLSKGRLRVGMGRGLARHEFHAFRGTMDESRERFDEAAAMIVDALRTGFIAGDGKFYKQPRTELHPRPFKPIDRRIYAVASSDDSVVSAAKLNARMMMFADRPWPMRMPAIQKHRDLIRQLQLQDVGQHERS